VVIPVNPYDAGASAAHPKVARTILHNTQDIRIAKRVGQVEMHELLILVEILQTSQAGTKPDPIAAIAKQGYNTTTSQSILFRVVLVEPIRFFIEPIQPS